MSSAKVSSEAVEEEYEADFEVLCEVLSAAGLKASTVAVYKQALRRAEKLAALPALSVWMRPRSSYAALEAALRDRSLYTLLTTVAGLTSTMRHARFSEDSFPLASRVDGDVTDRVRAHRQWMRIHEALSREVDDLRSSGRPYGRQARLVLTWAEVLAKDAQLRSQAPGSLESLLSGFSARNGCLRSMDSDSAPALSRIVLTSGV